jgi:hypothetical protein
MWRRTSFSPSTRTDRRPAGERDDHVDLAGREPDVGQGALDRVAEVRQVHQVVGDVLLTSRDAPVHDAHVAPRLRVDHEHAARTDDDQVDLRAPAARPAAIGKQVVADGRQRGQCPCGRLLGDVGDAEPLGRLTRLARRRGMGVRQRELASCLDASRVPCWHRLPPPCTLYRQAEPSP